LESQKFDAAMLTGDLESAVHDDGIAPCAAAAPALNPQARMRAAQATLAAARAGMLAA